MSNQTKNKEHLTGSNSESEVQDSESVVGVGSWKAIFILVVLIPVLALVVR